MKSFLLYLLAGTLFALNTSAQNQLWTVLDKDPASTNASRFSLDETAMKMQLSGAGTTRSTGVRLDIPDPEGHFNQFIIWENDLMSKRLKAKFPEIRTYSGVHASDPQVSLKMEKTTAGWFFMVFEQDNTYYINPLPDEVPSGYIVADKKEFPVSRIMHCETEGTTGVTEESLIGGEIIKITPTDGKQISLNKTTNGNTLRMYRIALACTGEYAEAVAGPNPTIPDVLSAMVVTLNRVNGIYERELGVHFQLVGNTDTLIFLDNASDPYSNFSAGAMLTQNQNTLNDRIGIGNYDLGHVFSTGGGGLAILGVACHPHDKAKGVTGMNNPIGDPFDVDYVSHEIGHQMGANHTFNACGGNTNMNTAYEPGSGSTIMAYAGICGSNNIQQHSDDYFHSSSLIEIVDFMRTGGSCAAETGGGAEIPIDSVLNLNFKIPAETPFELEGPAGGLNTVDSLLYSWEQWDLGNLNVSESNGGNFTEGPVFRSFYPSTTQLRIFPGIENVLSNNISEIGERLPQVSRILKFQYTIRNIENGSGAFRTMDDLANVEVISTGTPFEITYPSTSGLGFTQGATIDVNWEVAGTDQSPISCQEVDIYLSTDGGYSFPYLLAVNQVNDGMTTVNLPNNITTSQGRIKIKGSGNIFFDISNQNFEVGNVSINTQKNSANNFELYPNPAGSEVTINHPNNEKAVVHIVDISGKIIWKETSTGQIKINTSEWPRGLYIVKITQNDTTTVKKLTIQ